MSETDRSNRCGFPGCKVCATLGRAPGPTPPLDAVVIPPLTVAALHRILHFAGGGCDMKPEVRLKLIARECECELRRG